MADNKKDKKSKLRDANVSAAKERRTKANKERRAATIANHFNKESTRAERRAGLTKKPTRD